MSRGLLIVGLVLMSLYVMAQPKNSRGTQGFETVPLEGIEILLVVGGLWGIRKMWKYGKTKEGLTRF